MSYFDIDDILVEGEAVNATFQIDATELGYLDPNSSSDNVKAETSVQIPLWLADTLSKRGMVSIEAPDFLTKKFEQNFLADPVAMNLRNCCPLFYELGQRIAELYGDAGMTSMLLKGLAARYKEIIVRSTVWRSNTHAPFVSKLAALEYQLVNAKYDSEREIYKWTTGESIRKGRKRKLK